MPSLCSKFFRQNLIGIILVALLLATSNTLASEYFLGEVSEIIATEKTKEETPQPELKQILKLKVANTTKVIEHHDLNPLNAIEPGAKVVLHKLEDGEFYLVDRYRLPVVLVVFLLLIVFVTFITKKRGFFSLLGLLLSVFILVGIGNQILQGQPPLLVSSLGAFLISFITIYLAHGINSRTTLALLSTLISLLLALLLSFIFVHLAHLTGLGSEDAFYLQIGTNLKLNLQGILMSGIIIGVLGILDDITTTQVTAISEIKKTKPTLNSRDLFASGLKIGKEHILSMLNTLVLAYAGAAFPLFLLFGLEDAQNLWAILNSELVAAELIRTFVGSLTLVFAVPLACFFAAQYYGNKEIVTARPPRPNRSL